MATFSHISGAEPSTVTFKAATVSMTRNSSAMHQELISLADPESSLSIARVSSGNPASSDAGIVVRQVGFSTVVSVANTVTIAGNSTVVFLPAYLSTAASPANSTALNVRVVGGASSAADFPVQISGNSTAIQGTNPWTIAGNSTVIQGTNPWLCAITGPISSAAPAAGDSGVIVRVVGYSTVVSVAALPANSSQVEVRNTVTIAGNSTVVVSAFAAGLISSAAAAGNSSALLVRVVGGASSAADFIANVSSVAGIVAVRPSDTNWASSAGFHFDSSGFLNVNASFSGSTIVTVSTLPANSSQVEVRSGNSSVIITSGNSSVIVTNFAAAFVSTSFPAGGSSALIVRQVFDDRLSVSSTNAFASTSFAVASSVAGQKVYVTSYSITSTVAASLKIAFYNGSSARWPIQLQAISSAVSGANLSAFPYIFHGDAAAGMTLQVPSSMAGVRVGVSYFQAP